MVAHLSIVLAIASVLWGGAVAWGEARPPLAGLSRSCCLQQLPGGSLVFLDTRAAKLSEWRGKGWERSAQLPALPCEPRLFAVGAEGERLAVACPGSWNRKRRCGEPVAVFVLSGPIREAQRHAWSRLAPVEVGEAVSLVWSGEGLEIAEVPLCKFTPRGCERPQGNVSEPVPFWFLWKRNRWVEQGAVEPVADEGELLRLTCGAPLSSESVGVCGRFLHLRGLASFVIRQHSYTAQAGVVVATGDGGLWATHARDHRFVDYPPRGRLLKWWRIWALLFTVFLRCGRQRNPPTFPPAATPFTRRPPAVQRPPRSGAPSSCSSESLNPGCRPCRHAVLAPRGCWEMGAGCGDERERGDAFGSRCHLAVGEGWVIFGPPWVLRGGWQDP